MFNVVLMQTIKKNMRSLTHKVFVSGLSLLLLPLAFTAPVHAAEDDEGRRPPPTTRSAQTLTRAVYSRIEEVQEFRDLEQYPEALEVLSEVKELYDRDRLNNYEAYMMFVFYASIAMDTDDDTGAIGYWQQALEVPERSSDQLGQILLSLGQLTYVAEQYPQAIEYFQEYLDTVESPSNDVYLRIAMSHFIMEDYQAAVPWVLQNMEIERAAGVEIPENTFGLLRSLYFNLEDYPKARQVLREMIVLFDPKDEWGQLAQVEGQLDNLNGQTYLYYMANLKGNLDREAQLMTLAYQTYGQDDPWGAAQIIEDGIESGVIEENDENLAFMSLAYQVAREDELAIPPLIEAIELTDDGELMARLGRLYMNLARFDEAIEAMRDALETDDIDREDQLLLSMANALMFSNRFDEAIEAAQRAGREDSRSSDLSARFVSSATQQKQRYEFVQQRRIELADWF